MTRNDFLKTAAIAGAAAFAGAESVRGASPGGLKRGVTFYSYKHTFFSHESTLEELIAEACSIGANAIEVLPDDYPGFPKFSEGFIKQWRGWMDKYGAVADAYCQHQDGWPVEKLQWDIEQARRMGFRAIRMMLSTPLDVVEKALPAAEKANIDLLYEVHGPARMDGPEVAQIVALLEKTKSPNLGINPDFSLWEKRPVNVRRKALLRSGALKPEVARYIDESYAGGAPRQRVEAEVARMGGGGYGTRYVTSVYEGYQDPKKLLPLKPYVRRFHGKFYEMTEDYKETSIPYEDLIPFLQEHGFEGVIASEYEGQNFISGFEPVDEVEQVRRHQLMLKRLGVA